MFIAGTDTAMLFSRPLIVFCVVISWLSVTGVLGVTDIKVGVMLIRDNSTPYSLERVDPAIQVAIDVVNSEILNNTYRLVPVLRAYDDECSARNGTGVASKMYYVDHIDALIGPACSLSLEGVARLAGYWNIPIITGVGDSGIFVDKTRYPTLTRFAYCQCHARQVISVIFRKFNWTEVILLVDTEHPQYQILGNSLRDGLQKEDIHPHFIDLKLQDDMDDKISYIRRHSRVVILVVSGDTLREFLLRVYDLGYISTGEYVFLEILPFPFPGDYWGNHDWRRGDLRDFDAKKAYEALLRISLYQPTSEYWKNFTELVIQEANKTYDFDFRGEQVNFYIGAFYDGVIRYGHLVKEAMEMGIHYTDGHTLSRLCWNKSYTGVTGEYRINGDGDRQTDFAILDMDPVTGIFQPVAHSFGETPSYIPYKGRTIHWPGPTNTPPLNVPRCGYLGNFSVCEESDIPTYAKILLGLLALAIIGSVPGIVIYRRRRWEKELQDMSWQIRLEELNFQGPSTGSRLSRLSCAWMPDEQCSLIGKSCASFRGQFGTTALPGANQKFTRLATYKGSVVAVKPVDQEKIVLTRNILLELKLMQHIHHENITEFIGVVLEPNNNYIITEYCTKGSLQDVLQNDSIKLDWMFKLSLLRDIARGMSFLHQSHVKVHGRLRSTNCLVDRKFVLKISGFGLPNLCKTSPSEQKLLSHAHFEKLLWVAPEHLNTPVHVRTQKGDIYSFAIILEEVIHRALPYDKCRSEMGPKEIIALVSSHLDPPFRPKLDTYQTNVPVGVYSLMYRCWSETPEDRPSFPMIEKMISKLQGNKEVNLVEALIRRLEEYSSNLEDTVEERTQQLLTEKKKSEALLYQILPVTVADQLKQGKHVEPEMFDCVTVYFSDIVGFTAMSSDSSPVEIVEFLNDLYTLFDSVIENYNVYKVETIGDAYMCVSGLPIKTDDHAVEICRMALALLRGVKYFRIKHRPNEQLMVRIGIHSGSCAAGVVGLKMPRFCLFGDTVNTTSRMESTGEALKIHISKSTKKLLDEVKFFKTELRGEVEMKGKGLQLTYWLVGERHIDEEANAP